MSENAINEALALFNSLAALFAKGRARHAQQLAELHAGGHGSQRLVLRRAEAAERKDGTSAMPSSARMEMRSSSCRYARLYMFWTHTIGAIARASATGSAVALLTPRCRIMSLDLERNSPRFDEKRLTRRRRGRRGSAWATRVPTATLSAEVRPGC